MSLIQRRTASEQRKSARIYEIFEEYFYALLQLGSWYNSDEPGFAYELLSLVRNCVIPVTLKEGKGDRKAAVRYLKELIRNSEYAKFAAQASEFFKLYPGEEFSQTEVLAAFEQLGLWALNKNVLKAYNYDPLDTFALDRDANGDSSYEALQSLIGLAAVKEQIDNIIAADIMEKERRKRVGTAYESGAMHMVFSGNPGTARIVKQKFKEAQGGVLFVDEAYSLCDFHENSFGDEAISALVQEMENHRDDVIMIFAGYSDKTNAFLDRNPGMSSRIAFHVDFDDYSIDELCEITTLLLSKKQMTITDEALEKLREIYEKASADKGFGNGRFVCKMLEEAEMNLAERVAKLTEEKLTEALITTIELCDLLDPSEEKKLSERRQIGFRCA